MAVRFDPVAAAFMIKLKRIRPAAAIVDLYWGSHFLLGSITMTFAETGRIDALFAGVRADALDPASRRRVRFWRPAAATSPHAALKA